MNKTKEQIKKRRVGYREYRKLCCDCYWFGPHRSHRPFSDCDKYGFEVGPISVCKNWKKMKEEKREKENDRPE